MPRHSASLGRLPSGGEFSPGQIDLRTVLAICQTHAGSREAAVEEIRKQWYANAASSRKDPEERLGQQRQRADNVIIGLITYGLYDPDSEQLTGLGTELLSADSELGTYEGFARHILTKRLGTQVLQAVRALQERHERVTKASLAAELPRFGIEPPRATTHHLILLAWLRKAGVLKGSKGYEIDDSVVSRLTGTTLESADEWSGFTQPQRAFVRTLRQLAETHGTEPIPAKTVLETTEVTSGPVFARVSDRLRDRVFRPLASAGWISLSGDGKGRGSKSGTVSATAKLLQLELSNLPPVAARTIPADLRKRLNTPLDQIYQGLTSADTGIKGIALELLAIRMANDLGLTPVKLRLRGARTGGAEVDLIAEAPHLHFSRWLFQCKNTPKSRVPLSDLAREVGMCVLLKAHVVVMVTTGRFSSEVPNYAESLAETTPHQAVLVDRSVLDRYREQGGSVLLHYFRQRAEETLRLKQDQLSAVPAEEE